MLKHQRMPPDKLGAFADSLIVSLWCMPPIVDK